MYFNQAFLEKVILLVITALLTGFGIPYVLKRIEERKLREQKKFEADLVRQSKIIEAQSKLLDALSGLLWNWRYLAKKVVYYGAEENMERYDSAKKQYEEDIWGILYEFRIEISKSRRLVSETAYARLDSLYKYVVGEIDVKISDIIHANELDAKKSKEMAKRFSVEVSKKLDDSIDDLASELNLKVKN
jgi:RNAse (barnase) inhibitor barstar